MGSSGFLRNGYDDHEPRIIVQPCKIYELSAGFTHAPLQPRESVEARLRSVNRDCDDPPLRRGANSENAESKLVVVMLFLIREDRVIRERVRNLEQRKEKRRKRERKARRGTTKARGTRRVQARCGRSSGFVATNRSNHLSMQPSLAIRLTDTKLPRFRCTLELPSSVRCVFYSLHGTA